MNFLHSIVTDQLLQRVLSRKRFIEFSVHGLDHWRRVERNALYLAEKIGGDPTVVSLFALFHDSQRWNDFEDAEHGSRGAALAHEFYDEGDFEITNKQIELLTYACEHHTDTIHHDDLTVQCCWDGDRLDLTRISVLPDPLMLNTEAAKEIAESMDYSTIEAWASTYATKEE